VFVTTNEVVLPMIVLDEELQGLGLEAIDHLRCNGRTRVFGSVVFQVDRRSSSKILVMFRRLLRPREFRTRRDRMG